MESNSGQLTIIDPKIIVKGEKALVYSILTSVDINLIHKILDKSFDLTLRKSPEVKNGNIVIYNNQVAYSIDVEAVASFSMLLDKRGQFRGFATPNDIFLSDAEEADTKNILTDIDLIKLKEAEFLDALAATIDKKRILDLWQNITKLRSNGIIVYKRGDITIFNGHVTYRLTFDFEMKLSLFLDRKGKFLGFSVSEHFSQNTNEER